MLKNKQLISNAKNGDCFRACMTSILEIPNSPKFPHGGDKKWFSKWYHFLGHCGLTLEFEREACWKDGYWIASVPSKNFDCTHSIVMFGTKIVHDPSNKKQYRTGRDLMGKGIVLGGYFITVTDPSKIHLLKEFREKK